MITLAQRAEILKLARLLGAPADSLDALGALPAATIRSLREQATAAMFDADRRRFIGMANASRMLPLPILVKIIERAFGPLLCARTAGLLPVARALEIATRLETGFLTDTCIELDPRSATDLIAGFPVGPAVEISCELVRRGELITMGRFIDSVSLAVIEAVMTAVSDDATLLRIAFFAEDVSRLNEIVELLPPERLKRIIRSAAVADAETWGAAMALISSVDQALALRLAEIAGDLETDVLEQFLRSTQELGAWDTLLPIVAMMSEPQQRRVLNLPALREDALLHAALGSLQAAGKLDTLKPLLPLFDDDGRAQLLAVAARLSIELELTAPAAPVRKSKRKAP